MSGVNHGKRSLNCSVTEVLSYADRKMFAYRSILREPPRPTVIRENPRAPWLGVSAVCFGAFMGQLDASIVAITFPAMQREFSASVAAVQ